MKVFVSHSMKDHALIESMNHLLSKSGIKLFLAEHEVDIKHTITDKIKGMIEECHIGMILLTKNGNESGFVREEIGYLEAKEKPNVMIIEKGVEKEYGGFKYGHDYVELDRDQPEKAIEKIHSLLMKFWDEMKEKAEQKREDQKAIIIGLGLLAAFTILMFNDNK